MKRKIKLMLLITTMLTFIYTVPVNGAQANDKITRNTNKIKLIDDVINDKEFQKMVVEAAKSEFGDNWRAKIEKNQISVLNARKIDRILKECSNDNSVYPDYIGGLYIDSNDDLVIQVVNKEYDDFKQNLFKSISSMDNVKIKYTNNSYNELNNVYEYITNNVLGKSDNVKGVYIDIIENKVVIELEVLNDKTIKDFKLSILDSQVIAFKESPNFVDATTVNPGGGFTSASGHGCSYGYRAKTSSNVTGIVSAGHCFTGTGDSISGVGSVTKHKNNGTLDAAFVTANSGVTLTNTFDIPVFGTYFTVSTSIPSSYYVGQNLGKLGQSTGYSIGSIYATNYSYTSGGTTYTDLIRAGINVNAGDSGGIVIESDLVFPDPGYKTIGILKAKGSGNYSGQALITKATKINSTFSISRY